VARRAGGDARIAELERQNAELERENAELLARIAELEALVRELMVRLDGTSRNSHRPPSSDPPGTPPRTDKRGKAGQTAA
jgi:transposase